MKETGILNRDIASLLGDCGHTDKLTISDAGLPLPKSINVIDIAIKDNVPTVYEIATEISKHFSVEKLIFATEAFESNPSHCNNIIQLFKDAKVEYMPHVDFKKRTYTSKGVIRTGDFIAWANVILISGPGEKWIREK